MPVNVVQRSLSLFAFVGILALWVLSEQAAARSTRVALVIGNGGYEFVEALPNPVRDAADVADTLDELGFDVTLGIDLDRRKFDKLIDRFVSESQGATDVVFYYAGHGFQLGSKNHLVPVNAALRDRETIDDETFLLNEVIARLQAENRQTVVILDACRNNPLPEQLRGDDTSQGLAEIDTGRDLYVVFATEPGKFALDGQGRNSPFTKALLTHMRRPGLSISEIMVDLRRDVFTETEGAQLPWDQSSLRSQFSFAPKQAYTEKLANNARVNGKQAPSTGDAGNDENAAGTSNSGPSITLEPLAGETIESLQEKQEKPTSPAVVAEVERSAGNVGKSQANASGSDAGKQAPQVDLEGGGGSGEQPPETKKPQADSPATVSPKTPAKKAEVKKKPEKPAKVTSNKSQSSKEKAEKGRRPHAFSYSYKIWPQGNLRPGKTLRKQTPFGTLSCRGMIDEDWFGDERIRMCRWE